MDIALLEDNPTDARLIKSYIESTGHTCKVFETGQTLINELPNHSYVLLIIDWELPDITGDEILMWVRKNIGLELPVLGYRCNAGRRGGRLHDQTGQS